MAAVAAMTFFNFATSGIDVVDCKASNTQVVAMDVSTNIPQPDVILDIHSGGTGAGTRSFGFAS